ARARVVSIQRLLICRPRFGLCLLCGDHPDIQVFHFLPRPRRLSEELQAGAHARVHLEAADIDDHPELLPAVMIHERDDHLFQGDSVEWVFVARLLHGGLIMIIASLHATIRTRDEYLSVQSTRDYPAPKSWQR